MNSPYSRNKYRKKLKKSTVSMTQTQSNTKIEKIKNINNNKKTI